MTLHLDDAQVRRLLKLEPLLAVIRQALIDLSAGRVVQPLRSVMDIPAEQGLLFMKPALTRDALATKLITLIPGNPQRGLPTLLATIVLMDPTTGQTLAVMDGTWITALRTAAVSAVAVDRLTAAGSKVGYPAALRLLIERQPGRNGSDAAVSGEPSTEKGKRECRTKADRFLPSLQGRVAEVRVFSSSAASERKARTLRDKYGSKDAMVALLSMLKVAQGSCPPVRSTIRPSVRWKVGSLGYMALTLYVCFGHRAAFRI